MTTAKERAEGIRRESLLHKPGVHSISNLHRGPTRSKIALHLSRAFEELTGGFQPNKVTFSNQEGDNYQFRVGIPHGLSPKNLSNLSDKFATALKAQEVRVLRDERGQHFCIFEIVYKVLPNSWQLTTGLPVSNDPFKFYVGKGYRGAVYMDLAAAPGIRILGPSQRGKSSLASLITLQMIYKQWDVAICDPQNSSGWAIIGDPEYANLLHITKPEDRDPVKLIQSFTEITVAKLDEVEQINKLLREEKASNYRKASPELQRQFPPSFIWFEELTGMLQKTNDRDMADARKTLGREINNLARQGAKAARFCGMVDQGLYADSTYLGDGAFQQMEHFAHMGPALDSLQEQISGFSGWPDIPAIKGRVFTGRASSGPYDAEEAQVPLIEDEDLIIMLEKMAKRRIRSKAKEASPGTDIPREFIPDTSGQTNSKLAFGKVSAEQGA